ncbi:hypothetical protein [Phenylobacterium sp.]|uniref:hypothetical protein n=1 Tax=Phenylobacterium sp. TaxID=1871053 RepID=UPI001219A657|nr:hypothetical protein [Phenylobacterium sp.]THD58953.1 MAG: nitroreductase family protein [Phenylobacterium sp.]
MSATLHDFAQHATPSRQALRKVLHAAPAHPAWSPRPIPHDVIEQLHALLALGPSLVDASPTRVLFIASDGGKRRLSPYLGDAVREEALAAPACALIGYDVDFAEQLVEFLPRAAAGRSCLENPEVVHEMASRNGMLQGAYLIVAARALGLEVSVLFEFDVTGASFEFFRGQRVRANFLCALGYPAD